MSIVRGVMDNNEAFHFNTAADLMPFWRAVRMFKIEDEAGRVALLRKMVARKKAKYIRDVKTLLKGKRVGRIQ
jgi:hypothetical protein